MRPFFIPKMCRRLPYGTFPPPTGLAHLAAAHGKITMTNATEATDVAVDGDVVGRIREHKFRLGAFEEALVGGLAAGIRAQQTVVSQHPQVSGLGDDRAGSILGHMIFRPAGCPVRFAGILEDEVDFWHFETGQLDFKIEIDQALQLDGQKPLVPPGLLGEPVVRQDVSALLGLRCDSRQVGTASMPRSLAAATRPWPAMICFASSIKTGLQNPNFWMLFAICRI
jgi:hypothetical protein